MAASMLDSSVGPTPSHQIVNCGNRIGFLGALAGDLRIAISQCSYLRQQGVTAVIQLGDSGLFANAATLDRLDYVLMGLEQVLLLVDGNDDDFQALLRFPVSADGIRWLRPRIGHLPRGFRTTLPSGRTLAAFGGAGSLDRTRKRRQATWSAEEMITEQDLAKLGVEHVDIMVGHNAPSELPQLDRRIETVQNRWTDADIKYSGKERDVFTLALKDVSPELYLGGGFPFHVDQTFGFWNHYQRNSFACRVVLLDHATGDEATTAILDTETLELNFFNSSGEPVPSLPAEVTDLTTQTTGRWKVTTVSSVQLFDLDAMTWTRLPGPDATFQWYTPDARALHTLVRCQIGRSGFWTLPDPGDGITWHRSSVVTHIEPILDKENHNAGR